MFDETEPPKFEQHPGKTGAKRASFAEGNYRVAIERIITKHPEWNNGTAAGENLIVSHFKAAVEANEALFDAVVGYCVTNTLNAINKDARRGAHSGYPYADGDKAAAAAAVDKGTIIQPSMRPQKSPEEIAVAKAKAEAAVQDIVQQISLLTMIMPNGKPLRECTGTECGQFEGWYATLKNRVGKRKVGAVMTEEMLRSLQTWKE